MPEILSSAVSGLAPAEIAFCIAVVVAAGFMRGFTGFGFAMAAVPLLALMIAPARAVPFVILLQLMTGLWDWREAWKRAHWRSLPWLMIGALLGTPLGTLGLALMQPDTARLAIAGAVGLAVILLARGARLAAMPTQVPLVLIGVVAGVLNGIAAMPGPPVIVLYLAGPVGIEIGRASLLAFFAFSNVVGAASAGLAGLLPLGSWILAAVALPLMLGAQWLGRRLFLRASEGRYRQIALGFLAVLALMTAARAALAMMSAA